MTYATPAELRNQMDKTGTSGSGADANLNIVLEGVSQAIDRYFNRPNGWFVAQAVASARTYPGSGKSYQLIEECVAITAVAVKDSPSDSAYTSWAVADYVTFTGDPRFPDFNSLPSTGLMVDPNGHYSVFTSGLYPRRVAVPTVQVTARWGFALTCPPVLKQATLALAARWFKEGQGAWSDTLASADFGGLIYKAQNADIKLMLDQTRFHKPALGWR
jgi:hypothetical protein